MTINILLTLIAVLLLARIALQVWQGKETLKRYATASEVEHNFRHVSCDTFAIYAALTDMAAKKWEFIGVCGGENDTLILFFTRKKIKNYYDGKQ